VKVVEGGLRIRAIDRLDEPHGWCTAVSDARAHPAQLPMFSLKKVLPGVRQRGQAGVQVAGRHDVQEHGARIQGHGRETLGATLDWRGAQALGTELRDRLRDLHPTGSAQHREHGLRMVRRERQAGTARQGP
jgi:hypothetical protein